MPIPYGAGGNPGTSGGSSTSSSGTEIVPGMMDLYNATLGRNATNYQNVQQAYNQGSQGLQASLPGIYGGYGDLNQQIGNTLGQGGNWGVATPAAQAIQQAFATQQGNSQQQMINAGLGNTTALQNATNQNTLLAGQAYGGLGAQLAQTYAGYQAQTGLAGLQSRMQGLGMQSDMYKSQGQTLAGLQQQLPNVLGSFSNSTSTQASNNNPSRQGLQTGGGGGGGGIGKGGFLPMESGGGGQTYSNVTRGNGPTSSYNPYIGTPQNFGSGGGSSGGTPFPIGSSSGMGSNLGTVPIGDMIGGAIQDASNLSQYGNLDNPNVDWDFFTGQ